MLSEKQPKVPMVDPDGTVRKRFRHEVESHGHIHFETACGCESVFESPDTLDEAPSLLD
jgi:hypothetical protein